MSADSSEDKKSVKTTQAVKPAPSASSQNEAMKKQIEKARDELIDKLAKVSGLSKDQAKKQMIEELQHKLKGDVAKEIKAAEEEIKSRVEETAKEMLVDSMKHGATDYVAEFTLSTVPLPSDDVKGQIIGKNGRNIRAFELATGVDVDLEEDGVIKISSFDAVKREIAKISLERQTVVLPEDSGP